VVDQGPLRGATHPRARTMIRPLKRLGYAVGMVSGGFTPGHDDLKDGSDFDFASANHAGDRRRENDRPGHRRGRGTERARPRLARRFAAQGGLPLAQTVAIGDGDNDLTCSTPPTRGRIQRQAGVRQAADTAVNDAVSGHLCCTCWASHARVEGRGPATWLPEPGSPTKAFPPSCAAGQSWREPQ